MIGSGVEPGKTDPPETVNGVVAGGLLPGAFVPVPWPFDPAIGTSAALPEPGAAPKGAPRSAAIAAAAAAPPLPLALATAASRAAEPPAPLAAPGVDGGNCNGVIAPRDGDFTRGFWPGGIRDARRPLRPGLDP